MDGAPQIAMTADTVRTLLCPNTTAYQHQPAWAVDQKEDVFEKMGRLDAAGYFNGKRV
jgi:hypothetical protein